MLEQLCERFPERPRRALQITLGVQINRLPAEKGIIIHRRKVAGKRAALYWVGDPDAVA